MKFSISILAFNNLDLTRRCLSTVLANSGDDFELILSDNGSTDGVGAFFDTVVRENANVRVVHYPSNLGFEEPNKMALDVAGGEYFVMLNNDTEVPAGWLQVMEAAFKMNPTAALVGREGCCCELQDNFYGRGGAKLEYVDGACLMAKASIVRKHGLFAPYLHFAYGEDSDLSLRMRRIGYTIHAVRINVFHHGGQTSKMVPGIENIWRENHSVLCKVWAPYLKARRMDFPIVIKRAGAFGDVLLTTALIRRLHAEWPLCPIHYKTLVPDVLANHPYATPAPAVIPRDAWVIDLDMAYENRPGRHYIDAYAEAAGLAGPIEHLTEIYFTREQAAWADSAMEEEDGESDGCWCAIHCGPTHWACRDWPIQNFIFLANGLRKLGWRVILVGGESVSVPCDLSLIGRTTIGTLAAVLSRCGLFIGIDSMPLHVAQAVGTTAVGIFGGSLPEFVMTKGSIHAGVVGRKDGTDYGVRNTSTGKTRVEGDGTCIRSVTVGQVLAALTALGFPGGAPARQSLSGWIGVDLDGTLASYGKWGGIDKIGDPVPAMVARVKNWIARGKTVKIFTARVGPQRDVNESIRAREVIDAWCLKHIGQTLDVTATKDFAMARLYDDRCVTVETNTGRILTWKPSLAHPPSTP
jgi:GT2 family glycosyltransferase